MKARRKRNRSFVHEHSLSIVAIGILVLWVGLYARSSPDTHIGSFFGNAVADWLGVVAMILGTKYFFEKGSRESRSPPKDRFGTILERLRDHSLSIVLVVTGIAWVVLFASMESDSKWGQVVGNIASEWTQLLGLVILTKRLVERHSKESAADNRKR